MTDERSLVLGWRARGFSWQAVAQNVRRCVVDVRRDYDPTFTAPAPPQVEAKRFIGRVEAISAKVAEQYRCSLKDMRSLDRCGTPRSIQHARAAAYDACMSEGLTGAEVARFFGRDQSTIHQSRKSHLERQRIARKRAA